LGIIIILADTRRICTRIRPSSCRIIIPILIIITPSGCLISPFRILVSIPTGVPIRLLIVLRLGNGLGAKWPMGGIVIIDVVATGRFLPENVLGAFVQLGIAYSGGTGDVRRSEGLGRRKGRCTARTRTHVGACSVAGDVVGETARYRGSDVVALFSDFVKLLFGTSCPWWTEITKGGIFRLRTIGEAAAAVTSVQAAQKEGNGETENGQTSETAQNAACNRAS
jgi:hypothetical protein